MSSMPAVQPRGKSWRHQSYHAKSPAFRRNDCSPPSYSHPLCQYLMGTRSMGVYLRPRTQSDSCLMTRGSTSMCPPPPQWLAESALTPCILSKDVESGGPSMTALRPTSRREGRRSGVEGGLHRRGPFHIVRRGARLDGRVKGCSATEGTRAFSFMRPLHGGVRHGRGVSGEWVGEMVYKKRGEDLLGIRRRILERDHLD